METARLKTATRTQRRAIKKLGLETRVPLNVFPEEVNRNVLNLLLRGEIEQDVFATYANKTKQSHIYISKFWSSIASLFKANYQSPFT